MNGKYRESQSSAGFAYARIGLPNLVKHDANAFFDPWPVFDAQGSSAVGYVSLAWFSEHPMIADRKSYDAPEVRFLQIANLGQVHEGDVTFNMDFLSNVESVNGL